MGRRVVVTGVGICAPLGFEEVVQGECGLGPPAEWQVPELPARMGAVRRDVAAEIRALPGDWRPSRLDPVAQFALLAAHGARFDSGLAEPSVLEEAAVVIASALAGQRTHAAACREIAEHRYTGKRLRLSPFYASKVMPNAGSACVAMLLGAHGPNVGPTAACASGAYAIASAADLIRLGRAEVAFAGASDGGCEEINARLFAAGEALSPTGEALPFHAKRNGFVLGEGGAVLVLEEREHARRRGARIYAEMAGAGLTCDAYHLVAPHPDGRYAAKAMRQALQEAELLPDQLGYLNAHATGTPAGDPVECLAIRAVFETRLPLVSSTKGATGHLLGAAGSLEAAYTVLALYTGRIPPTYGLDASSIDPECAVGDIDFVPDVGRELSLEAVMTNSFAFGGHNASLVFTRHP